MDPVAQAVDAEVVQEQQLVGRNRTGRRLDGDLGVRSEAEVAPQTFDQALQQRRWQVRGRAAADVDRLALLAGEHRRVQAHLLEQVVDVTIHFRVMLAGDHRVIAELAQ